MQFLYHFVSIDSTLVTEEPVTSTIEVLEIFNFKMNFKEEENLRELWKAHNEIGDVDPRSIVRNLFESFARIISKFDGKTDPVSVNDIWWVFKQLYQKGMISKEFGTNDWYLEADSITNVFINNTKVIWFPESIQNPNFDTIVRTLQSRPIATLNGTGVPVPIWSSSDEKEYLCKERTEDLDLDTNFSQVPLSLEQSFETALKTFKKNFNNQRYLEHIITEYSDPKALVYTLQIATMICKAPPRTCVVINDLLFPTNVKIEKSARKYGTDAVRLYLLNMISMSGEYKVQEIKVLKVNIITPIIKSFKILKRLICGEEKSSRTSYKFCEHLNNNRFENFLEKYLFSSIETFKSTLTKDLEKFRVQPMIRKIEKFTHTFHTSLQKSIRQNKRCLDTLFGVMLEFLKTTCAFIPFTTESIYQQLRAHIFTEIESIHDFKISKVRLAFIDKRMEISTERLFRILEMVHRIRKRMNIPLKYQLPNLWIVIKDYKYYEDLIGHTSFIANDLNVENIKLTTNRRQFRIVMKAKPIIRRLERRFDLHLKEINRFVENLSDNDMNLFSNVGEIKYLDFPIFLSDVMLSYSIPAEMDTNYQTESDNEFAVILDISRKQSDIENDMIMEVIRAIQKIESKVQFSENLGVDCVMDHTFLEVATRHYELISKSIRGKLVLSQNVTFDMTFEFEETVTIRNTQILIVVYKMDHEK